MNYKTFKSLIIEWHNDTAALSGGYQSHKNYFKILQETNQENIKIHTSYLLLLLDEHVHVCLSMLYSFILNDRPNIPTEYDGRIPVIVECWKYWGLSNKYIKTGYNPNCYWYESCYDSSAKELYHNHIMKNKIIDKVLELFDDETLQYEKISDMKVKLD